MLKYTENIFPLQPKEVITDFEAALRKAINEIYPAAILRGCWFHFCKEIWKKCSELGMRSMLFSNLNAKIFQKQLMNVPLLPKDQIVIGFEEVKRAINASSCAGAFKDLLRYFESYWLKQVN